MASTQQGLCTTNDLTMASDGGQEDAPKKRKSLTLESGTSLAELEHSGDHAPSLNSVRSKGVGSLVHSKDSIESLRSALASDILTSGPIETFTSPFEVPPSNSSKKNRGRYLTVPLVYCDQTASNRPVRSIERYMEQNCLPLYGNTHTNTSITGSQSTAFVAEARQIVAEATNAKITGKASLDVVLFAGNGTTSAVELLIDCLGVKCAASESQDSRPVVFVGPYEHHSNLLPWRESGCEIVMVPECQETHSIDMVAFEKLLQLPHYAKRLKMGTFTAASNVTGKVCDVDKIAAILHQHGALAFFDYATGAPYMSINMNPAPSESYPSASLIAKDAVFISPHKMLGGVGTPGVLIVKKHLVQQVNPPQRSGGGTVFYVTNSHHRFLSNRIERYEGGTPNIAGIMRTGLTFLLKRKAEERYAMIHDCASDNGGNVPAKSLLDYEYQTYRDVVHTLKEKAPNLVLLGSESEDAHLPIFAFLIKCGKRFLHYNYVCAILNDVFGIQSRGGCQCSGPYSQRLLGLTTITSEGLEVPNEQNKQIEHALVHFKERAELLRPGYTRLSLPFKGLRKEEVEYVVNALEWVSKNGWALMCQYRCNHRTGEWRHFSRQGKPLGRTERKWLSHYDFLGVDSSVPTRSLDSNIDIRVSLDEAFANAQSLLEAAKLDQSNISQALNMNDADSVLGSDEEALENLRWYVYPKECAKALSENMASVPGTDKRMDIVGAIRPTSLYSKAFTQRLNGDSIGGKLSPASRKRKLAAEPISDAIDNSNISMMTVNRPTMCASVTDIDIKDVPNTENAGVTLFFFRDGEHTGEASIEDIETGFDEGELSENCKVFEQESDSWVLITDFLCSRKKIRTEKADDVGLSVCDEGLSRQATDENTSIIGTKEEETGPPSTDAGNQRKKPSRDSSTWGRASYVQLEAKPNGVEESGKTQDEKLSVAQIETILPSENAIGSKKKRRGRGVKPPPKMMRHVTQAMIQWNMVEEGDRLLLGLSGGKDSMSLLHCLLEFQRKLPINFTIEVCTIDPMTPSFDPSPLIPYVEALGLKYHYIRDDIVSRASKSGKDGKVVSSLCAFCARMKRGNLYTCARRNNCNKLVLAQHLDDCAESFLMSVMHNGFLRTMKANYRINAGDISVIRPMVYCRESLMTKFAKEANLPVINENCPACFEEPKERARIKKLLSREETLFPNLHDNIRRSLIPLFHDDLTAVLRCYTEEAVSKSRKLKRVAPKDEESKQGRRSDDVVSNVDGESVSSRKAFATTKNDQVVHKMLHEASEEELMMELAKRKAERYRLSGAMGRLEHKDDPTGQVCTLNGGNGSIPCRELME